MLGGCDGGGEGFGVGGGKDVGDGDGLTKPPPGSPGAAPPLEPSIVIKVPDQTIIGWIETRQ